MLQNMYVQKIAANKGPEDYKSFLDLQILGKNYYNWIPKRGSDPF